MRTAGGLYCCTNKISRVALSQKTWVVLIQCSIQQDILYCTTPWNCSTGRHFCCYIQWCCTSSTQFTTTVPYCTAVLYHGEYRPVLKQVTKIPFFCLFQPKKSGVSTGFPSKYVQKHSERGTGIPSPVYIYCSKRSYGITWGMMADRILKNVVGVHFKTFKKNAYSV